MRTVDSVAGCAGRLAFKEAWQMTRHLPPRLALRRWTFVWSAWEAQV